MRKVFIIFVLFVVIGTLIEISYIYLVPWRGQNGILKHKTISTKILQALHLEEEDDEEEETKMNVHADIAVYLRMTTAETIFPNFYNSIVVQSIRYFWPELRSLTVVLDDDRPEDHRFAATIQKKFPYPKVCFMEPIVGLEFAGYDRMQRDMFYPEKCTSKKFVGYIDTDSIFIARVIPEALFEDDKPIIIGIYGKTDKDWDSVAQTTLAIFKTREVMTCMSYFPVIMKVEHMIGLRHYLEKLHNTSLENILHTIRKQFKLFSQFNLMCQYVWTFHRHEYRFYFQHKFPTNAAHVMSKARENATYYKEVLLPEHTKPFPRICDHYKSHAVYGGYLSYVNVGTYRKLFQASICFAGGFESCPEKCKSFKKDSLRKEMFQLDLVDWTWDQMCLAAQLDYYKAASKYDSPEYRDIIRKACNEMNNITLQLP